MIVTLTCSECSHGLAYAYQEQNGSYIEWTIECPKCGHTVKGWPKLPGAERAYATFNLVGQTRRPAKV